MPRTSLEALQNAAKHAGPRATTRLTLRRHASSLVFSVVDDGAGMSTTTQGAGVGQGLTNKAERIEGVGGQLEIENLTARAFALPEPYPATRVQGAARNFATEVLT